MEEEKEEEKKREVHGKEFLEEIQGAVRKFFCEERGEEKGRKGK